MFTFWHDTVRIHYFCGISDKNVYPESNNEETLRKPKLKDVLHITWPIVFKSVKVMKENSEKLFQIEDERGHLNALYNPGLGRWSRDTLLEQSVNLSVVCE